MQYNIAAKPTRYNGVQFRSRLEARWAAFFDLCGWKWDYEPIDLQGWVPDFVLSTPMCKVFVEVKPVDIDDETHREIFQKATAHWQRCQVLRLGMAPSEAIWNCIGVLDDPPLPASDLPYTWADLHVHLFGNQQKTPLDHLWREAGNAVQWQPN